MDKDLERKLIDRFPSYFQDIYGDPRKTCMAWGCDHGNGWYEILEKLCEDVEKTGADFKFLQIKEKFGLLRAYYASDKDVSKLVRAAEDESSKVCEKCGTREDVTTKPSPSWIMTLCGKCRNE